MKTLLFLVGIFILLETLISKILESVGSKVIFLQKIRAFNSQHKVSLSVISASLLISSFVLSEFEKKNEEIQALEREKKILILENHVRDYKDKLNEAKVKLNEANSIIKNISISYSVGFEMKDAAFSESLLLGPSVIYGMIGNNVLLKSNGVTFNFISRGNGKFIIECNAALMDGDFPHGNTIDMFKGYKHLKIFIPFMKNHDQAKFLVDNYSISLTFNGVRVSPIVIFDRKEYPINGGAYPSEERNFGTIVHSFKNNLYDDLQMGRYLKTF